MKIAAGHDLPTTDDLLRWDAMPTWFQSFIGILCHKSSALHELFILICRLKTTKEPDEDAFSVGFARFIDLLSVAERVVV